jgi:cytochrome P450
MSLAERAIPSSIDLFGGTQVDPVADPYATYRRLRREAPVQPVRTLNETVHLLTRYDDVREALRNDALFSNRSNAKGISLVMGRTIVEMDGREHLRHRAIITPSLAPRALRGDFARVVEGIAHELIDRFAGRGRADLVEEFTFTYPLVVFTRILGLPVEDYAQIHQWAIGITHIGVDAARGLADSAALAEYLRPALEARKAAPTEDLISRLAHAEVDGQRLEDEEVISFLRLLVLAGAETTYHLIGSALYGLLTSPGQLEAVRADRSLLPRVMDEALRWESPVQLVTREALAPVELHGVSIPERAGVLLSIGSANRDERRFPEPDRFDIHREATEHVAFGFGKHYCAGSKLALLEARVALEALLERLPGLHLAPGEPCGVVGLAFRGPDRLPVRFDPRS